MKLIAPGYEKLVEKMNLEGERMKAAAKRDFEALPPEKQAEFLRQKQSVQDRMNAEAGTL